MSDFQLFLKFLKYILPYRKKQIVIFVLSGLSVLLSLVIPYLSKLTVDKAIINRELKNFFIFGAIGAGTLFLSGLIKVITGLLKRDIRFRLRFYLNKKLFRRLQWLSWGFFQNRTTGEHLFRISYDIERVVDFLVSAPEELVNTFPRIFFILAIMFYLDWQITLFSLTIVPILYLPASFFLSKRRKLLEELIQSSQNIFRRLQEVFSHIYLIKVFGNERTETKKYLRDLINNIRISLKNTTLEIISNFLGKSFELLIIGLIAFFGGYQVIKNRISIGTFTAIMLYLMQLVSLQSGFTFLFQRVILSLVSCRRLDEILEQKLEIQGNPNAKKLIIKEPDIYFKKVSFGYSQQECVLKNLEFKINKGIIALAGNSGCGKTTILNLLLRLYEPQEGQIFIGGQNIGHLFSLREHIGVAPQESFLWNDTIGNNIRYAKEDAAEEEVMEAASLAGVNEFVRNLPCGYNTVIGENACKLSEGQKQKIAIARGLIKKPPILILDEAMSSMDSLSEEKIIARIRKASWCYTVIIVSHRLSTVLACDLAYFLKNPDTIVIDKPRLILEKDKLFYKLFAAQIESAGTKYAIPIYSKSG